MAMAGSSSFARLKPKRSLDVWSTREKLCLASAVFKIGDQNWVSVSRTIKPYADANRPPEWLHQKNCVLQYYDLMEQHEQPKRKRSDRSESETPSLQIMRKTTIERSEQLKTEILEMQHQFKHLQNEIEEINAGLWDDRIKDEWETIQLAEKESLKQETVKVKMEDMDEDSKHSVIDLAESTSAQDEDDNTHDSIDNVSLTDDEVLQTSGTSFITSTPVLAPSSFPLVEVSSKSTSAASHLLSSLLQSNVKSAMGLQQLKREQEQDETPEGCQAGLSFLSPAQKSLLKVPVTQNNPLTTTASNSAPTLSRLLSPPKTTDSSTAAPAVVGDTDSCTTEVVSMLEPMVTDTEVVIEETVVETTHEIKTEKPGVDIPVEVSIAVPYQLVDTPASEVVSTVIEEVREETLSAEDDTQTGSEVKDTSADLDVEGDDIIKEEPQDEEEDHPVPQKSLAEILPSEAESSVKEEPLSPTSSISSRVSETGSKRSGIGKGRGRHARASRLSTRKSGTDDGGSSRHSDVELSEDEVRESEDLVGGNLSCVHASSILSESFPNSPASLSMCSDTEEEKSFKQWKKSILLVWRAATTHKYANVFVHPVTNEIAPGYASVVLRPMDLSSIKKNIETGVIRTTVEFQRDMMLMFTNAIMYNSSDHNVYRMAQEMYDDVMQHIEIMIQTSDAKNLRQSRRPDNPDKEEDPKKQRLSVDHSEGGKTKKRKSRADEPVYLSP